MIAGQPHEQQVAGDGERDLAPARRVSPLRGVADAASASRWRQLAAFLVHVYTASGAVFALFAAVELCRGNPDARRVFAWLAVALFIDSTDGLLARAAQVKSRLPAIDGRKIDELVDYLTFTFLPLLLVWRMGWLPGTAAGGAELDLSLAWIAPALMASLLGFANAGAKDESGGFFRGFPSYWNLYAYYAGFWSTQGAAWLSAVLLVVFTVLTVLPVRMIYPNLAPAPWRVPLLVGAGAWAALLLGMLPWYPDVPAWLGWSSLAYPAAYLALSAWLDLRTPRVNPTQFAYNGARRAEDRQAPSEPGTGHPP